jgi:hypothetical protein
MKTIYQGLTTQTSLTSLKIQFPLDRIPRPSHLIPAIPRLKYLHLANLDPLCNNDDVSLLLYEAQELEVLKMHWNPRMRAEREPSVNLQSYFGRLISSPRLLKIKELAMANLFSKNELELRQSLSFERLRVLTFINSMNQDNPATIFTDRSWDVRSASPEQLRVNLSKVKVIRSDRAGTGFSRVVSILSDLEEIYLLNPPQCPNESSASDSPATESSANGSKTAPTTPSENGAIRQPSTPLSPITTNSPSWKNPTLKAKHVVFASDYIAAIVSGHAQTLTKLLLPMPWSLGAELALHLVTSCPNLSQLALGLEDPASLLTVRRLVAAAPKLYALRILVTSERNPWKDMGEAETKMHAEVMSYETSKHAYDGLRWFELGGAVVELRGMAGGRRIVNPVKPNDARLRSVEIFGLDSMEI